MSRALIIVDEQNDFCEGGSLAVEGGAHVAKMTALYLDNHSGDYDVIVATKDLHTDPGDHWAPAGTDPDYVSTWPRHCEAGTEGAEFHPNVSAAIYQRNIPVFHKGTHEAAYSGFEGVVGVFGGVSNSSSVGLDEYLRAHDVDEVDIVGIATDFCVKATALDAAKLGYETRVLVNMTAAVAPETASESLVTMGLAGVEVAVI